MMNQNLIENNYLVIPNFISSQKAKELADQFKEYFDTYESRNDPQVSDCNAKYDFVPFIELLVEKTGMINQLVGESVLPTYSYARIYKNSNVLPGHVDKPQCEISITLNLECDQVWDIWIDTPKGKREYVSLNPGDAMLYLGMEAQHGRDFFEGQSCTQVFLHYVRSKGPCFKYYFDKDHRYSEDNIKMVEVKERPVTQFLDRLPKVYQSENKLSQYIKVYENVLTLEECELILNEYKDTDEWSSATVSSSNTANKNVRNCDIIPISNPTTIGLNEQNRRKIDSILLKKVGIAAKQYITEFPNCFLKSDSGYDLLRYQVGGYYTQHTDSFKEQLRTISMSINLNDDYIGGNIAFFDREIQIRGGAGSVVLFPSNFMYPHEIMPVEEGTRYSIVTWLT